MQHIIRNASAENVPICLKTYVVYKFARLHAAKVSALHGRAVQNYESFLSKPRWPISQCLKGIPRNKVPFYTDLNNPI